MSIPVAVQLYSVREDCARDLLGTLEKVKAIGYDGVEFAGLHGNAPEAVKAKLDELGLQVAGAHLGLKALTEQFDETVAWNQVLGNKFLIVAGLTDEERGSKEVWLETAAKFNEIAEKLAPLGLRTGYHNHTHEFEPFPGTDELPWDVFFSNTRADVVMQFDTGNALHGGAEALDYLKAYPGRATTVHLKEFSKDGSAMLGEGEVPLKEVLEVSETIGGTEWFIVEHETYPVPALECIERDLRNVEKLR